MSVLASMNFGICSSRCVSGRLKFGFILISERCLDLLCFRSSGSEAYSSYSLLCGKLCTGGRRLSQQFGCSCALGRLPYIADF